MTGNPPTSQERVRDNVTADSSQHGDSSTCELRAFGVVEATAEDVAELRKQPGPSGGLSPPANLLNHAEDQTVVALAAVLCAIHDGGLTGQSFTDWAVVGAPRFPGRVSFASSMEKFRRQSALSVSPLIIPFQSLHAVSSMISLALRIHGPSLGVGGGFDGLTQALLLGLSLRQAQDVGGVWVVVTGWDPEALPVHEEANTTRPVCRAAALALFPEAAGASGSRFRTVLRPESGTVEQESPNLPGLVRFLGGASNTGQPRSWNCPLNGNFDLELTVAGQSTEIASFARSA